MNDEPSNRALNLIIDGPLHSALNGYYGDEIELSFEQLFEKTNFFYEPDNYYSYNFFYEDDKLEEELIKINQWPWVCMILEESYHEINEELYSYLSKDEKYIQKLHWRSFEKLLDGIFKNQGYQTELGPGQNDGGVDIKLFNKDGVGEIITYVQVKRHKKKNPIKLEAVAALYGVMQADSVNQGIFVTSSRYLPVARKFEKKVNSQLELKDSKDVLNWCNENSEKIFTSKQAILKKENLIKKLNKAKKCRNDSIMYHSYGAMGNMNKFYLLVEDYGKYKIAVPIKSKYSSNTGVGKEIPDFEFKFEEKADIFEFEVIKETPMEDGSITMFGRDYIFQLWDGNPLSYDWHD